MGFVNEVKEQGLQKALHVYCPGIFVTSHVLESRKTNISRIIVGTIAIFAISFIDMFKRAKALNTEYNTLIYVPNEKYTRFLEALVEHAEYSYLVVSDTKLSVDSITVKVFSTFSRLGYYNDLIKGYFMILRLCAQRKELRELGRYYWNVFSVLRRDILMDHMLKKIKFTNFLSLQPIDSFHTIVHEAYKQSFQKTFAIRPTTTTKNKENEFFVSDVLFYKTEDELAIYREACLSSIQLERGGLMYPSRMFESKTSETNKCICFDTCTSKDEKWNKSRVDFLKAFLEYAQKYQLYVYYKFHPGLLPFFRKETENMLCNYDNVKVIENEVPWDEADFSIGFSSTIFFDSILHGVPVYDMGEFTYFFDKEHQDYCIKTVGEIEKINIFYDHREKVVNEQYNWICAKYNYPDGLRHINRMLMA